MDTTLSTTRCAALYTGALLGPSLLLLPGLAAAIAGPASLLDWVGLLVLSALLARTFTALGTRLPGAGGVADYVRHGLGTVAGRAIGWCFVAGVVAGAPVVCFIGGGYVSGLLGGGRLLTVAVAAALLLLVLGLTSGGARVGSGVQLGLVAALVVLVGVAVLGSAAGWRAAHWSPLLPHGPWSLGRAAAVLMLSFVGWEAITPMIGRLADPVRQLPRVIGTAFGLTALVELALAAATIGVLGTGAGTAVPLAALLSAAVGTAGPYVAAVAAVVLTLAGVNAYLSGATALVGELLPARLLAGRGRYLLQLVIASVSVVVLAAQGLGLLDSAALVALPTTLFLTVYLGCLAAAVRLFDGRTRAIALVALLAVAGIIAFAGWSLLAAAVVLVVAGAGPAVVRTQRDGRMRLSIRTQR